MKLKLGTYNYTFDIEKLFGIRSIRGKGLNTVGKNRPERVMKSKRHGKKEKQVKRLHIYMTVILVAVAISVAAAVVLACWQMFAPPETPESSNGSSAVSSEEPEESLPVYEDDVNLLLVNSKNKMPDNWDYQLTEYEGVELDKRILPALQKMLEDAEKDGISLRLSSGYVSAEKQDKEYNALIEKYRKEGYTQVRAEDKAQNTLGKGGYSESQTGLSVVFSAEDGESLQKTDAYQWLLDHCVEYGFIQRFPENKTDETGRAFSPGCFRYVGQNHAVNMRRLSMCLEEYVSYLDSQSG